MLSSLHLTVNPNKIQKKLKLMTIAGILLLSLHARLSMAQFARIIDHNTICWLTTINTISTGKKTSLHLEYSERRTEFISTPMQELIRAGMYYRINPKVTLLAGGAYFFNYPYSQFPSISPYVRFPERRMFEQIAINDSLRSLSILHRVRLEQRWSGRMDSADVKKVDYWSYTNRIRYLVRLARPIIRPLKGKGGLYAVAQNEIFISFGKNVKSNIFNQNRLTFLLGTRLTKSLSLECGYLNQIIQPGNIIDNKSVFQYNKGFQAILLFNK